VRPDSFPVALPRLPLGRVFAIWYGILALLSAGWLRAVGPASRVAPERGWLAIFALSSILMLAATPICWNHYFLWTLPAALFLLHRPRLMLAVAVLSLLVTMWPAARAAGGHMLLALGLFGRVVDELAREGRWLLDRQVASEPAVEGVWQIQDNTSDGKTSGSDDSLGDCR
jgi:alpha-1,2-mannosyltransferase